MNPATYAQLLAERNALEWSPNARGCPQNARELLLGTERGWTCDKPSDCDVEPHGSTPRKLGIQDARLLSGWLGSWLRNKA